jgi:hypothetical protein
MSRVLTPSSGRVDKKYIEHKFISYGALGTSLAGSAVTPQLGAYYFTFSNIANATNLALVYDQYRIDAVEVRFNLRNPGASTNFPRLGVFPDFDDANAPPTAVAAFSHPRITLHSFTSAQTDYSVALSPRPALAAYQGTFAGYTQPNTPVFMDCANPSIQHYGLKYVVDAFTDTTQVIDVLFKFWFTMRNPL